MEKIYICPNCKKARHLSVCDNCKEKTEPNNGIYDYLLKAKNNDFDEIGKKYYLYEVPEISFEIASSLSYLITDAKVLGLGCGTGNIAINLIQYGYSNLICMDSSLTMLDSLNKKIEGLNVNKVILLRADAHYIPLIDESIDIVIVSNLFHLLEDSLLVLKEIYRILSPTGKLILISDATDNNYLEFGEEVDKYQGIIASYSKKYWDIMKEKKYYPKKYNTKFNPYLEANRLFSKKEVVQTKPVIYMGTKTIQDFIDNVSFKSDYDKLLIPIHIHSEVHNEVMIYLLDIYGNDIYDIRVQYKGRSVSIIDVYEK